MILNGDLCFLWHLILYNLKKTAERVLKFKMFELKKVDQCPVIFVCTLATNDSLFST